jgi:predicted transcriptional regulator
MVDVMSEQVLKLTAAIVSAHLSYNAVDAHALPAVIQSVHAALTNAGAAAPAPARPAPAVPIKKSVFPDHIVCLEDGKRQKILKRHLETAHGLTPAQYREKWQLPHDYPMVAPDYAGTRSTLAKALGLGRKRASPEEPSAAPAPAPVQRGRKRAAAVKSAPPARKTQRS